MKLLSAIGKDDAGYEAAINRYAVIYSECVELKQRREAQIVKMSQLDAEWEKDIDAIDDPSLRVSYIVNYTKAYYGIEANINACDKMLQQKRKMLFDIEREDLMTIASQLRSIQKEPAKTVSPLMKALMDD